jgi:1,4-dihydroxy-2-naphthoate octaprenyltransferase
LAHANIAPPILFGQALAVALGSPFDPVLCAIAFGFGIVDHLFIVFTNDYADREGDAKNANPTFFSGGSRVIPEGLLAPEQLRRAAIGAGVLLLAASAAAGFAVGRPLLPAFALSAIAILVAYSLPPLRLSYRGYGELAQALGVGLVLPLMSLYTQTGDLEHVPYDAFGPLVLLGFASNILTALPDVDADRAVGKATWPVRRGEAKARRDALVVLGIGLLLVTQVRPELTREWLAVVIGPAALALVFALRYVKRADAANRADCARFVLSATGAAAMMQVAWSVALFLQPS